MKQTRWSYHPATPSGSVLARGCAFGGFSESSPAPIDRLELPAASTVIVLCCGESVTLRPALNNGYASHLTAFSAGLQVQAQRSFHAGVNDCIEIRVPPLAAYSLFGGAMAESNCAPIDLLDIARQPIRILLDQLQSIRAWGDRLAAVDQFLARGFAESKQRIPSELTWMWQSLEHSHGQIAISSLARTIGWSERHLITRCCTYFGVRPKTAARRFRFSHAVSLVTSLPASSLCMIATQAGFSDQSHMTREFREFSGLTPDVLRTARFDNLPGVPAVLLNQ